MTIREKLQAALDNTGVKAFWRRRVEILGDENTDEYIVYTIDGDYERFFADDQTVLREATATVLYYCRTERFDTEAGRRAIEEKTEEILSALRAAGFTVPSGAFNSGDIDASGYDATIIECSYERVV